MKKGFIFLLILVVGFGCTHTKKQAEKPLDIDAEFANALTKVKMAFDSLPADYSGFPRNVPAGRKAWKAPKGGWTIGFYPGVLWYVYEYTKDTLVLTKAKGFSNACKPNAKKQWKDHDYGFEMYCSLGNGLRIDSVEGYKEVIIESADSLATLFNSNVGTFLSWPWKSKKRPGTHNTIADNMMNLEMMFWAAKNGRPQYYDMAVRHADTTMKYHIRPDYSTYHVLFYDSTTGAFINGQTEQGQNDSSMWARGQAWMIYGYTMCYRETKREAYLQTAIKLFEKYSKELPVDLVPYWDFNADSIPNEPRDVSAACIVASALIELSQLVSDTSLSNQYIDFATKSLTSIANNYKAAPDNHAILTSSTGHKTANSEINIPIVYADYYYLEALLRLKKLIK